MLYQKTGWLTQGIVIALVAVGGTAVIAQSAPDPFASPPPKPVKPSPPPKVAPPLRKVLDGPEWDSRSKAELERIGGMAKLGRSTEPTTGLLVTLVDKGLQGDLVGLKAGDIITEVGGQPLAGLDFKQLRSESGQEVTLVGKDGRQRRVTLQPGKVGFNSVPVFRPELYFLHKGKRDAKWDTLALVGASSCDRDPDLSETAWARAIEAGYKADALSDVCAARAAWHQGRNDEARLFAARAVAAAGGGANAAELNLRPLTRWLAIANFDAEQAVTPDPRLGPLPAGAVAPPGDAVIQTLLKSFNALPAPAQAAARDADADGMKHSPLKQSLEACFSVGPLDVLRVGQVAGGRELKFDTEPGWFDDTYFRPTRDVTDVELAVEVKTKPVELRTRGEDGGEVDGESGGSTFSRDVAFALIDPTVSKEDLQAKKVMPLLLRVRVEMGQRVVLQVAPSANVNRLEDLVSLPLYDEVEPNKPFTVKLRCFAGRQEVWLDKRRLLCLPAARRPGRVGFALYNVGSTSSMKVEFDELSPGGAPPAAK